MKKGEGEGSGNCRKAGRKYRFAIDFASENRKTPNHCINDSVP